MMRIVSILNKLLKQSVFQLAPQQLVFFVRLDLAELRRKTTKKWVRLKNH